MRWTIVIGGYGQRKDRDHGSARVYRKVCRSENPNHEVLLCEWHENFGKLAERIADGAVDRVDIFAYSWGAGRGFLKLAKALAKAEVKVDHAVLSDPVYHSWLPPFRWLALMHWLWRPKIVIPENVRVVDVFFQERDRPRAAPVVRGNGSIWPIYRHKLYAAHVQMDDEQAFHDKCVTLARQP